jgi:hypothetical protein
MTQKASAKRFLPQRHRPRSKWSDRLTSLPDVSRDLSEHTVVDGTSLVAAAAAKESRVQTDTQLRISEAHLNGLLKLA